VRLIRRKARLGRSLRTSAMYCFIAIRLSPRTSSVSHKIVEEEGWPKADSGATSAQAMA
jgi:hypothetical protein